MDIFGQFWNFNIAINIDHVGITIISGFYLNTLSSVLMCSQVRGEGRYWVDKSAGRGGNGKACARGGVGAGFKLCVRGGNGVPVVTPCHSLVV